MSASAAQQFVGDLSTEDDLDGDLVELAAERGYDVTDEELRSALREYVTEHGGFHVDLDDVDTHGARTFTCHSICASGCPLDTCNC